MKHVYVFDVGKLTMMVRRHVRGPLRKCQIVNGEIILGESGPLSIWEEPAQGEVYDIGAQPTRDGRECGLSFQVFKRSNNEQVAQYRANIGVLDSARIIYSSATFYNNAHLAVEVNGIGYVINEALTRMRYPNIYRWRKRDHIDCNVLSKLTGWKTQSDTQQLLIAVAQDRIAHDTVIVHSNALYEELRLLEFDEDGCLMPVARDFGLAQSFLITQTIMRDEIIRMANDARI